MLMAWLQANRRVASPLGELLWRRKWGGGGRGEREREMRESLICLFTKGEECVAAM